MSDFDLKCKYCLNEYSSFRFPCMLDCREAICTTCVEFINRNNFQACPLCLKVFSKKQNPSRKYDQIYRKVLENEQNQSYVNTLRNKIATYEALQEQIHLFDDSSGKIDELLEAFGVFRNASNIKNELDNASLDEKLEILKRKNLDKYRDVNSEEIRNIVEIYAEEFIKINNEVLKRSEFYNL